MSRNRIILLVLLFAIIQGVSGQEYIVQGVTPNLHLSHKVAAKETWYSIGRAYNLSPKDIAAYNKLAVGKPLDIGQQIKIPLTQANFSQNELKRGESFTPVYHIVQPKEWLYRISVNHNKVPVSTLEKWNSISKDDAKPGMKLIVGYLKVKNGNQATVARDQQFDPVKTAEVKTETPVKKETAKPVEEIKKTETVTESKPATTENQPVSTNKDGSYFKSQFDDSGKASSGVSGIFKSTSGWKDGKYYALINNVPIGTIVKISYTQTNKIIYAKVLGEMPDMKENAGLALRISDAAANELGTSDNKFSVDFKY